jgi:hypothetical protein
MPQDAQILPGSSLVVADVEPPRQRNSRVRCSNLGISVLSWVYGLDYPSGFFETNCEIIVEMGIDPMGAILAVPTIVLQETTRCSEP